MLVSQFVINGAMCTYHLDDQDLGLSLAASCSSPFVEPFPPLEEDADIIAMKVLRVGMDATPRAVTTECLSRAGMIVQIGAAGN